MRNLIHNLIPLFCYVLFGMSESFGANEQTFKAPAAPGFISIDPVLPKQSQTFDDAREAMLLGNREAALEILRGIFLSKRDLRSQEMIENFSTQFLNQESETLFFQAVNLIGARKFIEAKERIELANSKDPHHVLILLRLGQVDYLLNLKDSAEERFKAAAKLNPFHRESKLFLALMKWVNKEDKESIKIFETQKPYVLKTGALFSVYLNMLKKTARNKEIEVIKKTTMSSNKATVLNWMGIFHQAKLNPEESKIVKLALEKCSHELERCIETMENDLKKDQFLWVPIDDPKILLKDMVGASR